MNISSTPLCITPIGPVPARLLYNISGCVPHIPDHRPSGTDLSAACEAPDTGWNRNVDNLPHILCDLISVSAFLLSRDNGKNNGIQKSRSCIKYHIAPLFLFSVCSNPFPICFHEKTPLIPFSRFPGPYVVLHLILYIVLY